MSNELLEEQKPTILYVDDEEENLIVFKSSFRRHFNVITVPSAEEGLKIIGHNDIALIITDQRMPHMTGVEFLKSLPEDLLAIRIILTGFSDVEAIIDAINTGKIYRYITKPWNKDDLKMTIDTAIESLNLKKKNRSLITLLKEANEELEQKVEERTAVINRQRGELEVKNGEILDSIKYAKKIQEAILPETEIINFNFPSNFIFYQPKDIVSGDFYWFREANGVKAIAAVDCTGHGVPGALMSMISYAKLNENFDSSIGPGEMMRRTNFSLKNALKQYGMNTDSKDGFDICMVFVDSINKKLRYAGANRPLWIIPSGSAECVEYKPTKASVGGITKDNEQYETIEIDYKPGDCIYLFTDGFADQFGELSGKKLMTKNFKEIMASMQHLTIEEQKNYLNKRFTEWKGRSEQIDDILIIGIKL
jgi:sigma-B regulation protein RsbU (phosphoserine phosphatase)